MSCKALAARKLDLHRGAVRCFYVRELFHEKVGEGGGDVSFGFTIPPENGVCHG